jgi:hypothetical protein
MARKLSLALALVALCSLTISGSKKPDLTVSFHLEGAQFEGAKMVQPMKLGNPPQLFYFRRSPELTQRHIVGFYPFLANDGSSFGTAFKLNQNGSDALSTISTTGQGRKLLTVIDTEPVDYTVLDQPINDGYIVVWGGLTKADLAKFDKKFERIQPERSPGSGGSLVPERATSNREEPLSPPPLRVEDATDAPKKRKRLFNFGLRKEGS